MNSTFYILTFLGVWCMFVGVISDALAQHRNKNYRKPILSPVTSSRDRKPNIVLILTDDQDVELGSLNFMPKTLRAIRDKGAEFRHAYVTTPMCCPSRSSLLTGMYMHNHNVYTNNDNCSSTQWQATHETRSFATYLSNAGYRTGYFGKYLNKYNGSYIPPGWREWGGLIMNSKYYNYSINMNGKKIKHGFDYHKDYYSDLIANDSVAFLKQSKKNSAHKPVMLTMSFPAPHGPEDSAPQYSHLFFNVTTHHTPSYDYDPNLDKQWILQVTNRMLPIHKQFTDLLMTKRLQTLQSVDSAVERVIDELEALGELHNTYIIYTSDHGYHLGQFGLIKGKSFPFEFDVRVPFLVRGPGVEPGTVVDDIVLNIDLAPTFLDMAGVETPPHMDGHSALPLFLNTKRKRLKWPDTFLIESSGRREYSDSKQKHTKSVTNTTDTAYVSARTTEVSNISTTTLKSILDHDSAEEVDITEDLPYEDDDDGEIVDDVEDEEQNSDDEEDDEIVENEQLKDGQVQLDNQLLPAVPTNKLERLAADCLHEEYQLPCQQGQKWYCQHEYGRWRKHKCKSQLPISHKKSYKKCACFTPNGLVYKKFPVNISTSIKKPARLSRVKREESSYFQKLKRHSLEHVDSIMQNIRDELNGLHDVNVTLPEEHAFQKTSLVTNIIEATPGCAISETGKVNCSMLVYQNRKMWRQSRHYIDNEIQRLRQKLENLKEIRRHLKYSRPIQSHYDINSHSNITGVEILANETLQNDTETSDKLTETSKKRKKLLGIDDENIFAKVTKHEEFTNATNEVKIITGSTNHHRHHHHRKHHHENLTSTETIQSIVNLTSAIPNQNLPQAAIVNSTNTLANNSVDIRHPLKPKSSPNALHLNTNSTTFSNEYCHCETEETYKLTERELAKEAKQRIKDERLRKRERRQRKKAKLEKDCLSEKMNCFSHDNDHWRTPPLWTTGPFCFCMNANNNTYSCIRTINTTHNFLYCEFTTGEISFYNLRIDPFELQNRYNQLKAEERQYLHEQLIKLMACKGKSCIVSKSKTNAPAETSMQNQRYHKRRKFVNDFDSVARTLPLSQSALSPNQQFFYNTRSNKLPKRSRRRNHPNSQHEFRIQQQTWIFPKRNGSEDG